MHEEAHFSFNRRGKARERVQMATDGDIAKLAQPPGIFCSIENTLFFFFKLKLQSMYFHLNYLAYRAQQEWLLIRFAVERKPTHDRAASEQTRVKMAGVCGGDCKILRHITREDTATTFVWWEQAEYFFVAKVGFLNPLGSAYAPAFGTCLFL